MNPHLQKALAAHQAGRLAEAEERYHQALSADGANPDALHLLGVLCLQKGNPMQAETLIRQALAIHENAFYLGNLGVALSEQRKLPETEAIYRRALELKPDLAEAYYDLGNVLDAAKRFDEAETAYRRALELKPDYTEAYINLGCVLEATERFGEAETAYRRALELKPDYAEARFNLAILLLSLGRYADAWPLYEARRDIKRIHHH